jgi:hypothetical protein
MQPPPRRDLNGRLLPDPPTCEPLRKHDLLSAVLLAAELLGRLPDGLKPSPRLKVDLDRMTTVRPLLSDIHARTAAHYAFCLAGQSSESSSGMPPDPRKMSK